MSIVKIINDSGGTSGGSGGGTSLITENVSSQATGSNINFSTSEEFIDDSVQVYVNGLLQTPESDYTEDSDNLGITFGQAPESTDIVILIYSV